LGNEFIINEILFSYFILLFKPVISGRDVTIRVGALWKTMLHFQHRWISIA